MAYEIYIGKVVNNKDPEKRGRLELEFEDFLGNDDGTGGIVYPDWIEPTFPFAGKDCGFFFVPPVDAFVECELYIGVGSDNFIDTQEIRWRAGLYGKEDPIPDELKLYYPDAVGFKTIKGHLLMFNDKIGLETIKLLHFKHNQSIELDKTGKVIIEDKNGSTITMDGLGTITASASTKIHLDTPLTELSDISTDPVLMGTAVHGAFTGFFSSLLAAATALDQSQGTPAGAKAYGVAMAAAATAMQATLATWLSTKVKTG